MATLYNLARCAVASTGTGTLTVGSAVVPWLTFAQAGVVTGTVSYGLESYTTGVGGRIPQGSEIGTGTYNSGTGTLTRNVTNSSNSNNPINLTGDAEVYITARAQDFVTQVATAANLVLAGPTTGAAALPTMRALVAADIPASAINLAVGTTPINSGTTTRILYDNAGILGEYTLTGSGTVVAMQNTPTLTTPVLGVASGTSLALGGATIGGNALAITGTETISGQLTSTLATGTAPFVIASTTRVSNLNVASAGNADTVTTNANLTGPITSVGNATSIASQTGTGSTFVVNTSPTLVTPILGVATATSLNLSGNLTLNGATSGSAVIGVKATAGTVTFNLPTTNGSNTNVLSTDGSGNLSWSSGGSGSVTSVSVTTANGFAGTVANATTTPAITLTTSITGVLSGNGTAISAASTTGSGAVVLATSPTLVTPTLGVAIATSLNGITVSTSTASTFTLATGTTVTFGNGATITPSSSAAIYYDNIPQNSQSTAYTLVLSDAEKHIYKPAAATAASTWTIPANASVAYVTGTAITFVNDTGAGAITIAITSDTLVLAGLGSTGSRTLAASGMATAIKMTSTRWMISGTGLS